MRTSASNIASISMVVIVIAASCGIPFMASAHHMRALPEGDGDLDGLLDIEEAQAYGTDPQNSDTDDDGYLDGDEVSHGYDPLRPGGARLPKRIVVDISEQRLRYSYGEFGEQGSFLISSAMKGYNTPLGTFSVTVKKPLVNYRGQNYNYPRTKWNLQFLPQYYIHGAWWHNNFGKPVSHGCVNVSYANMEKLYAFADVGTEIVIQP